MPILAPVVYEHAARFVGRSPYEVSRDPGLLVAAHVAAWECYRHVPVTVGIDLYNPEAEAMGARVGRPDGNAVPAIDAHPCPELAALEAIALPDPDRAGRLPLLLAAGADLRARLPGVPIALPVNGPFSLAASLMGLEALMLAAVEDAARLAAALGRLAEGQIALAQAAVARGLGVTIFESAAAPPLLSPRLFRRAAAAPLTRLVAGSAAALGRPPALVVGGDTAAIAADLVACRPGALICPAETDTARFLAACPAELPVRLNLPAQLLSGGDWTALTAAAETAVLAIAGRPGASLGTGVLPYDADSALVQRLAAWVAQR